MSLVLEAFVLPLLFLTVALLGGLRIGGTVQLVPPPLMALILAMVLVASLARAGVLRADRLMNVGRTPLENVSGLVVLLTLFAASAQILHLLTPDTGLLHVVFSVILFIQLLSTMAAGTGRVGLLRSLVVLLGSAFVLRWIVLESLYAPEGGTLKRVLTVLAEGLTLGTLDYVPHSPLTGYVALLALVLYMAGIALLAPPPVRVDLQLEETRLTRAPGRDIVALLVLGMLTSACGSNAEMPATIGAAKASVDTERTEAERTRAVEIRTAALQRARVWMPPAVPVSRFNLAENPPGEFRSTDDVACRFVLENVSGTTPKFNCQLPNGEVVKVKYGSTNPEIHAEVAATRLLGALGFGADRMYLVRKVRCAGCPTFPFQSLQCHAKTGLTPACFPGGIDYNRVLDFDPAVIERRLEGKKIEALEDQGWAWFELAEIDPAKGGSSRAEVDAFRLMAMLLAHWDNKAANQRLVCLPGGERTDGSCAMPLAMMQDVGATFGPLKLDLGNWRRVAIWKDAAACTVSMQQLPWSGATFPDHRVSEAGRQFLVGLLDQLNDAQVEDLFRSARVTEHDQVSAEARDPRAWARAFRDKVEQIRDAGPCADAPN
jgi:hypothetical protein